MKWQKIIDPKRIKSSSPFTHIWVISQFGNPAFLKLLLLLSPLSTFFSSYSNFSFFLSHFCLLLTFHPVLLYFQSLGFYLFIPNLFLRNIQSRLSTTAAIFFSIIIICFIKGICILVGCVPLIQNVCIVLYDQHLWCLCIVFIACYGIFGRLYNIAYILLLLILVFIMQGQSTTYCPE